ncbi:Uncharacterised protein [[Eubacterium] infirmum]|nr:Uncharacterised protein [[Eubacterium] infirmum]
MELTNIIALTGSILSVLANIYILKKNSKAALRAESSWREELMKVASSFELERKHLLRLRASQRYQYANIDKSDEYDKKYDITVRDKIGNATYDLYEKYILKQYKDKKITPEDQIKIRDLAIALLKYDFIKRGDNDNLRYFKNKRKREKEYKELSIWIDNYIIGTCPC